MSRSYLVALTVAPRSPSDVIEAKFAVAIEARAGVSSAVAARGPRVIRRTDLLALDGVSPSALLAILDGVGRDPALVVGISLGAPRQWEFAMSRLSARARASPLGLAIGPGAPKGVTATVTALLEFHMLALRQRTPAQWQAVDARKTHGTATAAAEFLGCSRQSVTKALHRAAAPTTARTQAALIAILDLAADAADAADQAS